MLKIEHITKSYNVSLLEDVTAMLGNKEKVGLVGLNGCGKTTLLKIIAGITEPDSGRVELINEKVGYLPQEFNLENIVSDPQNSSMPPGNEVNDTESHSNPVLVGEFLESFMSDPHAERWRVDSIMGRLGIGGIEDYQEINNLSEGQKMKLYLTKLVFEESTILLLDEPTNHLDIDGIMWFENFISKFDGICIIISHDRAFLNNTVTKIFEIDEKKLNVFEGNYDRYIKEKSKSLELREKHLSEQEKKREKLEKLLETARRIKNDKRRGKAVKAAKTRMEREVTRNEISEYREKKIGDFEIEGGVYDKKKTLELGDVKFRYEPKNELIENATLELRGREKVWFFGPNGVGKTTLVKIIMDEIKPDSGEVIWGNDIEWTYFSQDQGHLDMDAQVAEYFMEQTGISFEKSFGPLKKFLFPPELRKNKLGSLSPGQRARLSFAIFAQHEYDFLILDEPTNHLDIRSKEVIEAALREFQGGILLISHDRYFVESVKCSRSITLEKGILVDA